MSATEICSYLNGDWIKQFCTGHTHVHQNYIRGQVANLVARFCVVSSLTANFHRWLTFN
jgi:hypothetical protein